MAERKAAGAYDSCAGKSFDQKRRLEVNSQAVREALIADLEKAFQFAKDRFKAVHSETHRSVSFRTCTSLSRRFDGEKSKC